MTSSTAPLVSVVTPVFNEEQHLATCIESVLAQTYRNWEYIIVNNCSTDRSLEIARRYSSNDRRIRVVENKEFLKAVPNHNAALRLISSVSKYCKLVFADDSIFPECLERMVALAEANPTVGMVGAYGLEGGRVVWTGLSDSETIVAGREMCRRLFIGGLYVFGTATSLLYRADLVRSHDPFYNEKNVHADMEVCIVFLSDCDFGFVHEVLTFTRARGSSRIAMSRNINTLAASKLYQLMKYGSRFLSDKERAACVRRSLSEYYWYLAGSVFRRRSRAFWSYHKGVFRAAGLRLNPGRLAASVLHRICIAALNPTESIKRVAKPRVMESEAFYKEAAIAESGCVGHTLSS